MDAERNLKETVESKVWVRPEAVELFTQNLVNLKKEGKLPHRTKWERNVLCSKCEDEPATYHILWDISQDENGDWQMRVSYYCETCAMGVECP